MKNNLLEIRKRRGLLQSDVAKLLGFKSTDRISHWEKGRAYPSVQNLFKLGRIYEINVEELYGNK